MPYDELKECLRCMEQLQARYPDKDFSEIPGNEGLIDRVISSYGNLFKWWRNLFHDINQHAKKRTTVLGATLVAANVLLKLTIECGIASPLSVLANHRGFKDDIASGIFGKKKGEDKK